MAAVEVPLVHNKKIYDLTVPFEYQLGCLYPGKVFFISGIPFKEAARITMNLKVDTSTTAFHFDIRLSAKTLVRNTKISGGWGKTERYLNVPFPFVPDKFFEMMIFCGKVLFQVNDEALVEFKHRLPLDQIEVFEIVGDIRVTKVAIQG